MTTDAVRDYYREYDEWARLEAPPGRVEFLRAMDVLTEWLPDGARVLDVGGGPGRYTIALIERGFDVTLVDLSEDNIATARRKLGEAGLSERVGRVEVGDARDLSGFDDDSFDATIAFGPFYHLVAFEGRRRAARQVTRVTRPDGLVFAQFLPPLSGFARLIDRAAEDPEQVDVATLRRSVERRAYQNPTARGFQEGAYLEPLECEALFEDVGVERLDLLSLRGIAAGREAALLRVREADPQRFEAFMTLIEQTCRRPEVVACGQIALFVGRKRG